MTLAVLTYPNIDPIALRIGAFAVHWYGLAYLAAFVAAFLVLRSLVSRWGLALDGDDMLNIMLAAVVGVLLGGRLGYVLFYGRGAYFRHPLEILAIWDGGMSFHGGLIGIIVAGLVVSRTMGVPVLTLCDIGSVGAPIGLFFGRLANFVNGELWGRTTGVPWAMVFPGAGPLPRHPSQLYEALLEGVLVFCVTFALSRRLPPRPRGVIFGTLMVMYGAIRIFLESFRQPDAQIGFLPGGVTMGQLLSLPMVLVGIAVIVWAHRAKLPQLGRTKG